MNTRIINILFYCIAVSLCFNNIPESIRMPLVGYTFGPKLVVYPLTLGLLYTLYCEKIHGNVLIAKGCFFKYLSLYIGFLLFSLLYGVMRYPFYNDILNTPIIKDYSLPFVINHLNNYNVSVTENLILKIWLSMKALRTFFMDSFFTFFGSYMIFCWFRNRWIDAFMILNKSILFSLSIICIYSLFLEIPYLVGNEDATAVLSILNPCIHSVEENGLWWPPLLWYRQLRSIFAEPSYFGIYFSFALPFLWYNVLTKKNFLSKILLCTMLFLLFLTKARTGIVLFLGETFLLIIIYTLWLKRVIRLKAIITIILCSIVAFYAGNFVIYRFIDKDNFNTAKNQYHFSESMTKYVDSNVSSVVKPDKRSNRARFSLLEADFRIGLDFPLIGVGRGLRNGYIPYYLSNQGKEDKEIKSWLNNIKQTSVLKAGFPPMGEYTVRIGETGFFGLIIFLFPALLLLYKIIFLLRNSTTNYLLELATFSISLFGVMCSGIGDTLDITYCYWLMLGIGYAICFSNFFGDIAS